MNWLLQNWIWVALAIGAALFFSGAMRGHAGHGAGLGGLAGGMGHGGHDIGHGADRGDPPAAGGPQAAVDPVGGAAVRTSGALTSVYQGRIYYFSSRENRDRFEAAPQEYAHNAVGYPMRSAESDSDRPRRRGGC
jgi:YHS domain-containing protein